MDIKKEIEKRSLQVAVIGLGYVGLPLAISLVKAGYKVIGIDYNQKKVATINEGKSDVDDISSEIVKQFVEKKN